MRREDIPWLVFALALLAAGFLIGQHFVTQAESATSQQHPFRVRFWEERGLDLAVQVALVFVGALSIAALLPPSREDDAE